ncbi:MAG: helix-turn-helix domain-containing protein, partial [Actinobacteria bacterium]|nr:helix-turn-helix domain-containing protein [Actinomycetota bacterium]
YFGGSVAVEDLGRRIIAYSSVPGQRIDTVRAEGILARRVPDSPHNAEQYRSVIRADLPLKFPQMGEELPRAATTIRAGALPLGTIWAIDPTGDGPLSDEHLARLRSAATVAAAHMLDDVRMRETGQLPRENRLRALLSGDAVTGAELSELGIPEQRGALLIAFDLGRDEHATALAQLRSTVQRHLALHAPETVSIARRGRVYSLLADRTEPRVAELLEPLLGMLEQLVGGIITVAVSGRAQRAIGVAHLREQVDRLFDVADGATSGTGAGARLLTVAGLRPALLLERVREQFDREPELREPELAELIAEQPQVAVALRHWLENLGNVSRAAAAAGVHENTIRYRLRRAEQQYGVKLHDPDALLATWLQLRAQLG